MPGIPRLLKSKHGLFFCYLFAIVSSLRIVVGTWQDPSPRDSLDSCRGPRLYNTPVRDGRCD